MKIDEYDYNLLIDNVNTANTEIKILEQEDMDLPIPAIKQLRDVTYHIVKALESQENPEEFKKQMNLAEGHAIRAKYDMYELRIMWYLENIKSFTQILSSIKETVEVMPNYAELLYNVQEIKNNFEDNLNNRPTSRENYYLNIKNEINELKKIHLQLQTSLPVINQRYIERKDRDKQKDKATFRNYVIGITTIVVTVIGIIIAVIIAN